MKKLIREKNNKSEDHRRTPKTDMTDDTNNLPYHPHWQKTKKYNKNQYSKSKQNNTGNNRKHQKVTTAESANNKTVHDNPIVRQIR